MITPFFTTWEQKEQKEKGKGHVIHSSLFFYFIFFLLFSDGSFLVRHPCPPSVPGCEWAIWLALQGENSRFWSPLSDLQRQADWTCRCEQDEGTQGKRETPFPVTSGEEQALRTRGYGVWKGVRALRRPFKEARGFSLPGFKVSPSVFVTASHVCQHQYTEEKKDKTTGAVISTTIYDLKAVYVTFESETDEINADNIHELDYCFPMKVIPPPAYPPPAIDYTYNGGFWDPQNDFVFLRLQPCQNQQEFLDVPFTTPT